MTDYDQEMEAELHALLENMKVQYGLAAYQKTLMQNKDWFSTDKRTRKAAVLAAVKAQKQALKHINKIYPTSNEKAN